ncbi:MAG TPA: hypothetical protein VFE51_26035 [Verrucomicrobiae bacterium]|nr:hypothetical protein [Verrucomicrobiae bacterium]
MLTATTAPNPGLTRFRCLSRQDFPARSPQNHAIITIDPTIKPMMAPRIPPFLPSIKPEGTATTDEMANSKSHRVMLLPNNDDQWRAANDVWHETRTLTARPLKQPGWMLF